jgi:hypothetical protein
MTTNNSITTAQEIGLDTVAELAAQLRVDSIRASTSAGSGHPTSSMSAADLVAVLVARHLHYDWGDPRSPANDHLIFSKGHASPLLYSVFKAVGVVSEDELMSEYRRFGQRLQGHPTPSCPGSTSPPAHSVKGCQMVSASHWPADIWSTGPTGCGCCAVTAKWRRARCGRRWTRLPTTSCPT